MKRFKEFLLMFLSFVGLGILVVLYIGFNCASVDVLTALYETICNGFFIVAFLYTAIPAMITSVGMTFVYTSFVRNKMSVWGRRKYYIYLYLMSLIMPVFFIIWIFDLVMGAIFSLQIGILVVFIHWVAEWIREKRNSSRK
ncbi:MAG: hypothetical protein J6A88_09410 [Oscillospiraceae bacterium]|nr:hypothetical protein [Oscillospiraceae bacterium]